MFKPSIKLLVWMGYAAMLGLSCTAPSQPQTQESKTMIPQWEIYQDVQSGLYGYKDPGTGQQLKEAIYADAFPFSHGLAAVCLEDTMDHIRARRWGYINVLGEVSIPFIFSEAAPHKETLQISDRIQVVAAKVKFLPRMLYTDDPNENPYYVDLMGNCIPQKSSKTQVQYHARRNYETYIAWIGTTVFFEQEGQITLSEEHKKDIHSYIGKCLMLGYIPKIRSGEMQFKIEGHQSIGASDQGTSLKRVESVKAYIQDTYPSLADEAYYFIEDRGSKDADTSLISNTDRNVLIICVKK